MVQKLRKQFNVLESMICIKLFYHLLNFRLLRLRGPEIVLNLCDEKPATNSLCLMRFKIFSIVLRHHNAIVVFSNDL